MGTRTLILLLALAGCGDDGSLPPDAGLPGDASTADGSAADSGPGGIDPTTLVWEPMDVPAEGPLTIWGFMVADLGDGRAVLFGGTTAGAVSGMSLDGAWMYDMRGTEPVVTQIEATGPSPRYCACMAWDPVRERVVLANGRDLVEPFTIAPETWELDITAHTWTQVEVPESPPGEIGCAMTYSAAAGTMYLFGGAMPDGYDDRIWRYDPTAPAWVPVDASGPPARYDAILLPLDGGRTLLMHAGSAAALGEPFYSDVWLFDVEGETWRQLETTGEVPPGRRAPWTVLAPDESSLYIADGYNGMMLPMEDQWFLDLRTGRWTQVDTPGPTARGFSPRLPGLPGSLGTMMGGFDAIRPVREMWQLKPGG